MVYHKLCQLAGKLVFAKGMNIFRQDLFGDLNPCFQDSEEPLQLLFFCNDMAWDVHIHYFFHFVTHHGEHTLMHIGAFEDGTAVSIDHFALLGNHIVILDHVFTNVEVVPLDPGLSLFNESRNHATLKGHIFVHTDHLHHF